MGQVFVDAGEHRCIALVAFCLAPPVQQEGRLYYYYALSGASSDGGRVLCGLGAFVLCLYRYQVAIWHVIINGAGLCHSRVGQQSGCYISGAGY